MKKTLITLAAFAVASVALAADAVVEDMVANQYGNYSIVNGKTYDATDFAATNWSTYHGKDVASMLVMETEQYASFHVGDNQSATISKIEAKGDNTFTKVGNGTLTITDTKPAPKYMVVDDGTLHVGDSYGARYAYNYTANNGGTLELGTAATFYADSITLNGGSTLTLQGKEMTRALGSSGGSLTLNGNVIFDMSSWDKSTTSYQNPDMALFSNVTSFSSETGYVQLDFGNGNTGMYELIYENNSVRVKYDATVPVPAPAIPEPTTATLSLLALAGLAARRRRK